MNRAVFITGASGFIGGKLAERLLAEGRRVKVLARRPLPILANLGAEIITGDLADEPALRHGCENCDTVFHVAGRVGSNARGRPFLCQHLHQQPIFQPDQFGCHQRDSPYICLATG